MKPWERIGANLRKAREARGLTREALAARCSLSEGELAEIERGEAEQRAGGVIKIEEVLAVAPGSAFHGVHWDQRRLRFLVQPPDRRARPQRR